MNVRTGEWIAEGWQIISRDLGMHLLVGLIAIAVSSTGVGSLVLPALVCGHFYMIFRKMRAPSAPMEIGDLARGFDVFLDAFVASLLIGVFISLGVIACFVGMFIVQGLLMFTMPLIIDRRMKFWDAISLSYETTKSNWFGVGWFSFVFGLLLGAIMLLTCGVGALIVFPFQQAIIAAAYNDTFGIARVIASDPLPGA